MINDAASPSEKFSKDAQPFFSVIILFWKGSQYIQKCLNALDRQTFRDFEIILIDNASPEPLPQDLLTSCPDLNIRFFKQNTNLGFAAGNNYGSSLATGQFLALLNSDAFPKPDWLKNVNAAVQTYPDCSFASRLIMAEQPDLLDGEGDVYHVSRVGLAPIVHGSPGSDRLTGRRGVQRMRRRSHIPKAGLRSGRWI